MYDSVLGDEFVQDVYDSSKDGPDERFGHVRTRPEDVVVVGEERNIGRVSLEDEIDGRSADEGFDELDGALKLDELPEEGVFVVAETLPNLFDDDSRVVKSVPTTPDGGVFRREERRGFHLVDATKRAVHCRIVRVRCVRVSCL